MASKPENPPEGPKDTKKEKGDEKMPKPATAGKDAAPPSHVDQPQNNDSEPWTPPDISLSKAFPRTLNIVGGIRSKLGAALLGAGIVLNPVAAVIAIPTAVAVKKIYNASKNAIPPVAFVDKKIRDAASASANVVSSTLSVAALPVTVPAALATDIAVGGGKKILHGSLYALYKLFIDLPRDLLVAIRTKRSLPEGVSLPALALLTAKDLFGGTLSLASTLIKGTVNNFTKHPVKSVIAASIVAGMAASPFGFMGAAGKLIEAVLAILQRIAGTV